MFSQVAIINSWLDWASACCVVVNLWPRWYEYSNSRYKMMIIIFPPIGYNEKTFDGYFRVYPK